MEALVTLIKQHTNLQIKSATVTKVNGDVCEVSIQKDRKEIFKVSLNAIRQNVEDKMVITPKEGSTVIIGVFENLDQAVIIAFSDVEKIYFKKGTTELEADVDGFKFNRKGKNLKETIVSGLENQNKLNKEVQKILVSIGTSPNIPNLVEIEKENNEVIKDIKTILK